MNDQAWRISGVEVASCNCAFGCPCQFNARPSRGQCEAVWAMRIDAGHYGAVDLGTLVWGFLVWWPGAIHEGNGRMQLFGEARATAAQRDALLRIASGKVSSEGTYFQIFAAMAPHAEPAIWAPIRFELDLATRRGRLQVEQLVDLEVEPIRNPVTGDEQRARVVFPDGFEFREAEFASGQAHSEGAIALDHRGTHAHLARVGWDRAGCYTE